MENLFTIGILLKTIDQATRPITEVSRSMQKLSRETERTLSRFERFKNKLRETGTSLQNLANTILGIGAFQTITGAFSELEEASTILKSTFMEAGGKIPEVFYVIDKEAKKLGTELPGTTADFYQLAAVMKQLGVKGEVLARGGLRAAAYLAVALRVPYTEAGAAVAQFSQALGIAGEDLVKFMDIVQRLGHLGVSVGQMSYAFSKLSATLRLVGWQGLDSAKRLAPLVGRLIQLGRSGEEVGTNLANMFEALMNTEKIAKVNELLSQYGVTLNFIDETTGKLKAPEQVIAELSKIGTLVKEGVISRSEAMSLFEQIFGSGASAEFAITFALEGVEGYNRMQERMAKQADLQRRVALATSTLKNTYEAFLGTLQNVYAAVGETIAPTLKKLTVFLNNLADATERFFKEHKTLGAVIAWGIAIFTAFSATMLVLGTAVTLLSPPLRAAIGILKLLRLHTLTTTAAITTLKGTLIALKVATAAASAGIKLLSRILLTNPIGLVATAIALAGFLVYKNWEKVKGLWDALKSKLSAFTSWLSSNWKKALSVFLYLNPITAPIMAFRKLMSYLKSLNLFSAGRKIILSLWEGIKSVALKPVEAINNITQKIRNFLPFSPAKEGPLKDLHKTGFKLVQTIAASITPVPLIRTLSKALSVTFPKSPAVVSAMTPVTTSTPTINVYLGGITINGSVSRAEAEKVAADLETQIMKAMEKIARNRWRREL